MPPLVTDNRRGKPKNHFERDRNNAIINQLYEKNGYTPPQEKTTSKEKQEPFLMIPKKIESIELSAGAKALYYHMKFLEDRYKLKGKFFFHSQEELAKEMNSTKKTTAKWLHELINAGVLITTCKAGQKEDKTFIKKATYYTFVNGF